MPLIIPAGLTASTGGPARRAAVALLVDAMHPAGHVGLAARLRAAATAAVQCTTVATAIRPLTGLPERLVRDQLDAALAHDPDAIGLGDPGDAPAAIADALADRLASSPAPLIVAPDAVDRHRRPRFEPKYLRTLAERLFRHAEAVVLDGHGAEVLTGRPSPDLRRARDAARRIADFGSAWVVLTGGRMEGHAVDLLYDGRDFIEMGADREDIDRQVGASAALAGLLVAHRARGAALPDAVAAARAGLAPALKAPIDVGHARRLDPLRALHDRLGLDPTPIEVPDAE